MVAKTASLAIGLLLPVLPLIAQNAPMFRGNPAHTANYAGPGLPQPPRVRWKYRTAGHVISSPAVVGGTVYVGSTDGGLYALDRRTGRRRWRFATGARVVSSPAVAGDAVFILSYDGNLSAVDTATGHARWQFSTKGEHRFTAPHLHGLLPVTETMPDPFDYFLSSPTVVQGTVYVGSSDGNVYAVDARTGRARWQFHTGDVVHASPAVADGIVYVGSWDSYFYALDAQTGRLRWKFKGGEDHQIHNQQGFQSSATVVAGTVYVGCRDAHLYALDARTGRSKWVVDTKGSWVNTSPVVYGGRVYFSTVDSRKFQAVDAATGRPVFAHTFDRGVIASPAIAGQTLCVASLDGELLAFDLKTHRPIWRYQSAAARAAAAAFRKAQQRPKTEVDSLENMFYEKQIVRQQQLLANAFLSSPVFAGGTLFIGNNDGYVYAFR